MNRACKESTRQTPKVVTKAEDDGGTRGAYEFDGRENLGEKPLKQVVNKDQGQKGKANQATRIPN